MPTTKRNGGGGLALYKDQGALPPPLRSPQYRIQDGYNDVLRTYKTMNVIGVGPCRVANYVFGDNFFWLEDMPAAQKYSFYTGRLNWIAGHLRSEYHSRYGHLANIEIFYELCEYNKALVCWYLGGGKPYGKGTNYSYDNHMIRPLSMDLEAFTAHRSEAVAYLDVHKGELDLDREYPLFEV